MATTSSSWIKEIRYANGFLAIFTRDEKKGQDVVLLYAGVPSWVKGILLAGTPMSEESGVRHSTGRAYARIVKGKYQYQRIEDRQKVEELRSLLHQ